MMPQHVGVIMDGNRRWAKARGVSPIEGHQKGYKTLTSLLPAVQNLGIPYITIYAFSTENWSRTKDEVAGLMKLVMWAVKHELKSFIRQGVRIRVIGSYENVPADVAKALREAEVKTAECTSLTVGICFNYGGKQEIADAVKQIIGAGTAAADVTPQLIADNLYAPDIPAVDLMIRTSGEERLSGFMLWRSDYAELYFTDVLWPDFDETELQAALTEYSARKRRFGA